MAETIFDIAVIGGGVNGCGVARDAAGRGLKVVLFERGDLAGATSSASTKLIHGGLRYLEQYAFRLVGEALNERAILRRIAPHLVHPLTFILPHHRGLRPRWMLRIGLFLYDHLGERGGLPSARSLDLTRGPEGAPLKPQYRRGFAYSDCWTDDARLVVTNAVGARELGADIRTHTEVVSARREEGLWRIETSNGETTRARALVNAAGPWVNAALALTGMNAPHGVRLVKGSHIATPKLYDHDAAYLFQNGDGRVVFAIPYRDDFTLIGTTDVEMTSPEDEVEASPDEIAYLCRAVSDYFKTPVTPDQVVWTYAGVRALADEGSGSAQSATRDYVLTLDAYPEQAPLVSVYGGKITTYRRLAEGVMDKLKPHLQGVEPAWTANIPLPGGDLGAGGFEGLLSALAADYRWLSAGLLHRLATAYGSRARRVLGDAKASADLGEVFTGDLTAREVDYLVEQEWARSAEDVLWRRTKLGLNATPEQAARLDAYLSPRVPLVSAGAETQSVAAMAKVRLNSL
jgi:glycerol-3-phosphate dehydrogenase